MNQNPDLRCKLCRFNILTLQRVKLRRPKTCFRQLGSTLDAIAEAIGSGKGLPEISARSMVNRLLVH